MRKLILLEDDLEMAIEKEDTAIKYIVTNNLFGSIRVANGDLYEFLETADTVEVAGKGGRKSHPMLQGAVARVCHGNLVTRIHRI